MDGSGDVSGRLLILDEPTASLDLAHQQQVLDIARGFSRAGGTVLAVPHDLNLAASVADLVCLLKGGKMIASGPATKVLTAAAINEVFSIETAILDHPRQAIPLVVTLSLSDMASSNQAKFNLF